MRAQPVVYAMPAPQPRPRRALIATVWFILFGVVFFVALQWIGSQSRVVPPSELGGMIDPASLAEALDTECPTEDSSSMNCHWNGGQNGEGSRLLFVEGHTFLLPE